MTGVGAWPLYGELRALVKRALPDSSRGSALAALVMAAVRQPTKFEFALNLKAAKALGLTIPPIIMVRVDEVTE